MVWKFYKDLYPVHLLDSEWYWPLARQQKFVNTIKIVCGLYPVHSCVSDWFLSFRIHWNSFKDYENFVKTYIQFINLTVIYIDHSECNKNFQTLISIWLISLWLTFTIEYIITFFLEIHHNFKGLYPFLAFLTHWLCPFWLQQKFLKH